MQRIIDKWWRFMEHADIWILRGIVIGVVGVGIIQSVHCRNKEVKEDKVMVETKLECHWPEVFDTKVLDGRSDAALCADGLMAWSNCMARNKPYPNFGEVIAKISLKLGILGTAESFMEKAKEYHE